jgi:ubiquinone/menaquinone biosynthesis C-methylase UbiE/uncharacterized protein YbaR (Trm112 family)
VLFDGTEKMKTSLLEILACPLCQKPLEFEGTSSNDRVVKGFLCCSKGHLYQVKDEIPIIKDPKLSRRGFIWKVKFPNLQRYEEIQKQYWSYLSEEQRKADKALIAEMLRAVSEEKLVLDIASGMGRLLLVLSQHLGKKFSLLGTDVDETPLRGAKLKLEEQKSYSQVSLCVMDGKHLAIKPQKLPCATSYFGLDNIPETKKAFEEVYRVLMPKGRLVIATLWLKEGSRSLALAEKFGFSEITTEDRLFRVLEETEFKIDSATKFYSGKWPYNPMDRIPI